MATIAEFLASVGFQADEKSLSTALAKVAGFGAAVSAAAGLAIASITSIAESQVSLAKGAEKLGVSIQKLEELNYVAEQTGASTEALAASLGALKDKYPHIKDASTLFEKAGQRMAGMNEQARKLYAQRMGIDPSLIPMLTQDVSALKGEFSAMYAVAGTDAQKAAEDSKAFLAEMGKLKTLSAMLTKAVNLAFIGRIRGDIENLRRIIMENFDKIRRIFETIIGVVLRAAGVIGAFVTRVVIWASSLVSWYDKLDDGQKKLVQGAALLLAAWKLLNMGFLATPIGALIAGLTAIFALVDDYCTYMEGGESYFDWGPWEQSIEQCVAVLKTLFAVFMELVRGIGARLAPIFEALLPLVQWFNKALMDMGKMLLQVLGGDVAGAINTLLQMLLGLSNSLQDTFFNLCGVIASFFTELWGSVARSFPDFAAWAEGAAKSIMVFFAPAVDWIKGKLDGLLDMLPNGLREKLGLGKRGAADKPGDKPGHTSEGKPKGEGDNQTPPEPASAKSAPAPLAPTFNPAPPTGPVLTPSPARAAQIDNSRQQNVKIDAKTEINVNGVQDPAAVGQRVAGEQSRVNADTVRHMKGATR